MTFAQALARIESCLSDATLGGNNDWSDSREFAKVLLWNHADSIVQLVKVAEEMRAATDQVPEIFREVGFYATANDIERILKEYDRLMEGGE